MTLFSVPYSGIVTSAAALGNAREAIRPLVPGASVFMLTKGQFSLIDLVVALVDRTGPADVRLSTWSTGIRDAQAAASLLDSGVFKSLRLYTDRSFPTRQPRYAAEMVRLYGPDAIRCTEVHAKVATIKAGDWRISVRSSMNLNKNPRFEQADVSDNAEMTAFIDSWLDELDAVAPAGFAFENAEQRAVFDRALTGRADVAGAVASMVGAPELAEDRPMWARAWGAR